MRTNKGMGFKPKERADGGLIKGQGTGTSDDIKTDVPQGSYIMPADSTQKIGADALAGLGMGAPRVPVNVSNGEFSLPPEQVHAVGVQALDAMRGATHDPIPPAAVARNGSELFFANGGVVNPDDEKKPGALPPGVARTGNSYSDAPPSGPATPSASGFSLVPRMRDSGSGWRTDTVLAGTGQQMSDEIGKGQYGRAAGTLVRGTLATVPAVAADVGDDLVNNPVSKGAVGFLKGLWGVSDKPGESSASPPSSDPTQSGSAAPSAQAAAPAAPAKAATSTTTAPAPAAQLPNDVTRVGNSYSGSNVGAGFTINGRQPGGGFAVVPSSVAADQFHAASAAAPAATGFQGSIADPRRAALRDQVLSAALNPLAGSRNGQLTANQLRTAQGVLSDEQRTQAQADQTSANNTAAMERQTVQEAGTNARFAASNALDRQRVGLDQQRVGLDTQERGFKIAEAQRLATLQKQYDDNPDQREAIAKRIRDLSGKETPNRFTVVAGGQEIDPASSQLVTRPARVFNNQTGQFVEQQPSGPAVPKSGEVRNGFRFKGGNPAEQKNWEKV